jgi:hypothetical protein
MWYAWGNEKIKHTINFNRSQRERLLEKVGVDGMVIIKCN